MAAQRIGRLLQLGLAAAHTARREYLPSVLASQNLDRLLHAGRRLKPFVLERDARGDDAERAAGARSETKKQVAHIRVVQPAFEAARAGAVLQRLQPVEYEDRRLGRN